MLTAGTWDPLRWVRQSDFYDAQARALLNGTLAIDQRVLGIESFARGDQRYMYFGPVPALLRMPVVAVTRSLDGRLAAISMFCALIVTLWAVMQLGWNIRRRVVSRDGEHDAASVSRIESVMVGITMFAIVGASSLLYASARTWVYHEAIAWGVALTLVTIVALLAWIDVDDINSRRAHLLVATTSVCAMLALLTRPSVAGGALAALGLIVLVVVAAAVRRRGPRVTRTTFVILSAAVAMPVVVYSVINWLKFRRLLGIPFDQQGFTLLSEQRRDMLAANGGTLFNWKFVPTNLTTYLRPDLIGIDGQFPFIQARRPVGTIGSPVYDLIDLTAGIPTTMPFLVALGLVGAWTATSRGTDGLRHLRPVLIGGVIGTVAVLAIGYLANRYQSDFLPLIVVSALVGLPVASRWLESLRERQSWLPVLGLIGATTLVATGLIVNLALGFSAQRAYGPIIPPSVVAGYIDTQVRVDDWLGDGRLANATAVEQLEADSEVGDVAVLGRCDALYISDGGVPTDGRFTQWHLAELADDRGASRGTVTLRPDSDEPVQLVQVAVADTSVLASIDVDDENGVMTVRLDVDDGSATGRQALGPDLPLRTGRPLEWRMYADPFLGRLEVFLDGRWAAYTEIPMGDEVTTTVGASSSITTTPVTTPVCDRLNPADEQVESSG